MHACKRHRVWDFSHALSDSPENLFPKSRTARRIGYSSGSHALANLHDRYSAYYWLPHTQSIILGRRRENAGWPVLEKQSYRDIIAKAKVPDPCHLYGSVLRSSDGAAIQNSSSL